MFHNLMMKTIASIIVIFAHLEVAMSSPVDPLTCTTDRDCSEDQFCHHESNFCSPCVDCATHGKEKSRVQCAQSAFQCGDCLPGYVRTHFDETALVKRCYKGDDSNTVGSTEAQKWEPVGMIHVTLMWTMGIIMLCTLIMGASYVYYQYISKAELSETRIDCESLRTESREPPPPYLNEDVTTRTPRDDGSCTFDIRVTENGANDMQKAVPFCSPSLYHRSSCIRHHNIHPSNRTDVVENPENESRHDVRENVNIPMVVAAAPDVDISDRQTDGVLSWSYDNAATSTAATLRIHDIPSEDGDGQEDEQGEPSPIQERSRTASGSSGQGISGEFHLNLVIRRGFPAYKESTGSSSPVRRGSR